MRFATFRLRFRPFAVLLQAPYERNISKWAWAGGAGARLLALEEHVDGRRLEGQRAKLHGGRHVCRRRDRDVATWRRSRNFRVVPIPQTVRNVPKRSRWTPAAGTDEVDQNGAEMCRFSTFRHVSVLKTFISTHTHFRTLQSHTSSMGFDVFSSLSVYSAAFSVTVSALIELLKTGHCWKLLIFTRVNCRGLPHLI